MKEQSYRILGASLTGLLGIAFLSWWFLTDPQVSILYSVPGLDNKPAELVEESSRTVIGSIFRLFDGEPGNQTGTWSRFRGDNSDNIAADTRLADSWDNGKPVVLWTKNLGEGHAGAAVYRGTVFLLDYNEENQQDLLRCFSLSTGMEIWHRGYNVSIKRNHGMSRTVPAVNEKYVLTIGPRCHVMCVDRLTGDFKWGIDLVEEWGAEEPLWYTAQCPLIDGNQAVIAVGASSLMIGVDINTGVVLWKASNPGLWKLSHSSIMPMTLSGKRIYVYAALGGVAGVSAEPGDAGTIVFSTDAWNHAVVAPSPVIFPDNRIYLTAGYGAGSMMLDITQSDSGFISRAVYSHSPREGIASEQQTPVLFNGYLFGILPKDGGVNRTQFICYDPANRRIVWQSGKTNQFGLGPYIMADNKFYILNDNGVLVMIRASLTSYEELGRKQVLTGTDAWAPLAVSDGLMLLRDSGQMVCIDLK